MRGTKVLPGTTRVRRGGPFRCARRTNFAVSAKNVPRGPARGTKPTQTVVFVPLGSPQAYTAQRNALSLAERNQRGAPKHVNALNSTLRPQSRHKGRSGRSDRYSWQFCIASI